MLAPRGTEREDLSQRPVIVEAQEVDTVVELPLPPIQLAERVLVAAQECADERSVVGQRITAAADPQAAAGARPGP